MTFQIGYLWFSYFCCMGLFLSCLTSWFLSLPSSLLHWLQIIALHLKVSKLPWSSVVTETPPALSSCLLSAAGLQPAPSPYLLSVAGPQPCVSSLPKLHFPTFCFHAELLHPYSHSSTPVPTFAAFFPGSSRFKTPPATTNTVSLSLFLSKTALSIETVCHFLCTPFQGWHCMHPSMSYFSVFSVGVTRQEVLISFCIPQDWRLGLAGKVLALMTLWLHFWPFTHLFHEKMTAVLNQNFLITPHYPSKMLLPPGTHWSTTLNYCNYHKW